MYQKVFLQILTFFLVKAFFENAISELLTFLA